MASTTPRRLERVLQAQRAVEGAGVSLRRAFGQQHVPDLDPFLLLDDMRSQNPLEFEVGFPWHPHRGIETVTYVTEGRVEHEDSLGNRGNLRAGDVQWMTAGRGIIHQEMPKAVKGVMGGFQLWVNLPSTQKMTNPRYQDVQARLVPEHDTKTERVRVVAGRYHGLTGPVTGISVDPTYLDVNLEPGATFEHALPVAHRAFAYVLDGRADFDESRSDAIDAGNLAVLAGGDHARVRAGARGARFLLVAGRPLGEPVAWWGPIVMNTRAQLAQAVHDYNEGTFLEPSPASA